MGALYAAGYTGREIQTLVATNRLDKLLLDSRIGLGLTHLRLLMPLAWSKRSKVKATIVVVLLLAALLVTGLFLPIWTHVQQALPVARAMLLLLVGFWVLITLPIFAWRPAFLKGHRLSRWVDAQVRKKLPPRTEPTCANLQKMFRAVATDVKAAEMVYLDRDFDNTMTVGEIVRASAAIPFVFAPVRIGKRLLIDGGLTQNLPVGAAEELAETKDDIFITVKFVPASLDPRPTNWFYQFLLSTIEASRSVQADAITNHRSIVIELTVNLNSFDFAVGPDEKIKAMDQAYTESLDVLRSYKAIFTL